MCPQILTLRLHEKHDITMRALASDWTLNGGTQKRERNVVLLAVTTWQGGIKNTKSPICPDFISDSYNK